MNEQHLKSTRRWLRFSLRSMLLLVVVVSIPMAWKVNRARNQRIVVAELQKLNADIIYDYQVVDGQFDSKMPQPGPRWLTTFLGEEYFLDVAMVWAAYAAVTNDTVALIARLPDVEQVNLEAEPGITDDGLVHFAKMQSLQRVVLYSNRISGPGVEHLTGLKRLTRVWASGWITDASLEHVSKLKGLEGLSIVGATQITDVGLAHVAKLRKLTFLQLGSAQSSDQDFMKITDEGLGILCELKNLEFLFLNTAEVTRGAVDELQIALPNCGIKWNPKDPSDSR